MSKEAPKKHEDTKGAKALYEAYYMPKEPTKTEILTRVEIRLGGMWWDSLQEVDRSTCRSIDNAIEDIINLRIKRE